MDEYWQLCKLDGDAWDLKDSRRFESVQHAIVALSFETGRILHGLDENGGFRVKDVESGETIAAVRHCTLRPLTKIGASPEGRPGPLKRWRGLTWVGWLNFLVLRWLLFRIGYTVEPDGTISRYYVTFMPTWRWNA